MLPFGGQGANSAMEDGGALGYLFRNVHDPARVEERLALFERVRINRVSRIQTLSKARAGQEKKVQEELKKYADSPGSGKLKSQSSMRKKRFRMTLTESIAVPSTHQERTNHDYVHDVFAKCREVLGQSQMGETMVN